ncbi:MAG TPA: pitrilysin family protein [Thermoanaerobaculia bacterium]|nr:pitrilysin family protein [Thermoanaerobaculia bacterium]
MAKRLAIVLMVALLPAASPGADLEIQDYVLPNGLRVVLNEDHSTPLVAVNLWYYVGSANERPGRTGFAHLFEHMLFSGSENVGNNAHFGYIQSVGGVLNGSTSFDRTNYYETVPSHYLPMALWLEADRMGFFLPALDQAKLDVQKQVVKEERRQRYDNVPYGTWIEDQLRLLFPPTHPYSWPTIGSMDDLTAAEMEDVRQFFRTYYSPSNAVLTIVGDFDPAQTRKLVARYFGPIPAGPAKPAVDATLQPLGGEKRRTIEAVVQLPRVYRMYRVPPIREAGWVTANLLVRILADGKASRLERALVLEQQIAQSVNAFVWPSEKASMLAMWIQPKPGITPERAEASAESEIRRLIEQGPSATELERARNGWKTEIALSLAEFASRADQLSMAATYFGDPREVNRIDDRIDAVTVADVQNAARAFLAPENRVTVTYVPKKTTPAGGAQ